MQLPKIYSPALVFLFGVGFGLRVVVLSLPNELQTAVRFQFGAYFEFFLNRSDAPTGFGVSLVSVVLLVVLWRMRAGEGTPAPRGGP